MRKVDFEKIEKDLEDVLRNISVKDWLEMAALSNLIGGISLQAPEDKKPREVRRDMVVEKILESLSQSLKQLKEKDSEFFQTLGLTDSDLEKFSNPTLMNKEGWEKLKGVREKLDEYLPAKNAAADLAEDEKHVEKQRKKHVTKRFNVRESWLPLDTKGE